MKLALGLFLTLLNINSFGQCSVATMDLDGYRFNHVTEGMDPKKKFDENNFIGLLRVDSTKSKTESYFLTIQLKTYPHRKDRLTTITVQFTNDRLVLREQNIKLSDLDYAFGFDENEIFYNMDKYSYDKISKSDLLKIEVHDRGKLLDVLADRNVLKRLTKCLR
jgi:hypothetical protein